MGLIKLTAENPDELFKSDYPVLAAGKHLFVVANRLEVTQSASGKDMVKLEARCQDEDEGKGLPIFENFLIISTPVDEKEAQAKKIHDARFAQFTAACGVASVEDIKAGKDIDLDEFYEKPFEAVTKVAMENVYPEELGDDGKPKKEPRARLKKFLFDAGE